MFLLLKYASLVILIVPFSLLDIDECSSRNNTSCPTNAHCINVIGSYTCECFHGYQGMQCSDVDECKLGTHTCGEHANCINTVGSFKCTCKVGFYNDGFSCQDINECRAGSHTCDKYSNCVNLNGSYTCVWSNQSDSKFNSSPNLASKKELAFTSSFVFSISGIFQV